MGSMGMFLIGHERAQLSHYVFGLNLFHFHAGMNSTLDESLADFWSATILHRMKQIDSVIHSKIDGQLATGDR